MAAVNNDGELAIDISESDEMEELLQKEIDLAGIDCEARKLELTFTNSLTLCRGNRAGAIAHSLVIKGHH